MKPLADFLPFVLPAVPGCSDPMAEQAVLSACIEFAGRSLAVQENTIASVVVGVTEYDVDESAMQQLAKVLAVYYYDQPLKKRSREMVTSGFAARGEDIPGYTAASGTPTEWFCRNVADAVVSVHPPASASAEDALTVVSAYVPTRSATRVADVLYTDYAEDIAAGAIARLLIVPGQPFTNPALYPMYQGKFSSATHQAANLVRVGIGAASSRVNPGFFAGRR